MRQPSQRLAALIGKEKLDTQSIHSAYIVREADRDAKANRKYLMLQLQHQHQQQQQLQLQRPLLLDTATVWVEEHVRSYPG
jgi:hypothetical protein